MKNWNDYKEYVKTTDPVTGKDLAYMEEHAKIISTIYPSSHFLANVTAPYPGTPALQDSRRSFQEPYISESLAHLS